MKINKYINISLVIIVIVLLIVLLLSFINFGKLVVPVPGESMITVNNVAINSSTTKLRPGTYNLIIKTQGYETVSKPVSIKPFQTTTINDTGRKQTDEELFINTLRLKTLSDNPRITDLKRYEGNWVVGVFNLGSASPGVIHLENNQWQIMYFGTKDYINRLSEASPEVQSYVRLLKARYSEK